MGELDFDKSSQARYWMYDEKSLEQCREQACQAGAPRVRKSACGYANKKNNGKEAATTTTETTAPSTSSLSPQEQEKLVAFHAYQIQKLIGPEAIFPTLRRGASVLSTAIMLFKRFYLSNSVLDYHPRDIATASALLAAKSECSQRIPVDVLSHATWIIQMKTQHAPLCREELKVVTIPEIEAAERALLHGCDGFLRCHHPYGAIKVLAADISSFLIMGSEPTQEFCVEGEGGILSGSPKSVMYGQQEHENHHLGSLCERALSVAQWALVYSDVHFLFPPGQIAFAAVAVALDGHGHGAKLGNVMRDYLDMRFRSKTSQELSDFEGQVGTIISLLEKCSSIDLSQFSPNWQYCRDGAVDEHQAAELHRVFYRASHLRDNIVGAGATRRSPSPPPQTSFSPVQPMGYYHPHHHYGYHHQHYHPYHHHQHHYPPHPQHFLPITESVGRKRRREDELQHAPVPPHAAAHYNHKVARVTPVMMDY